MLIFNRNADEDEVGEWFVDVKNHLWYFDEAMLISFISNKLTFSQMIEGLLLCGPIVICVAAVLVERNALQTWRRDRKHLSLKKHRHPESLMSNKSVQTSSKTWDDVSKLDKATQCLRICRDDKNQPSQQLEENCTYFSASRRTTKNDALIALRKKEVKNSLINSTSQEDRPSKFDPLDKDAMVESEMCKGRGRSTIETDIDKGLHYTGEINLGKSDKPDEILDESSGHESSSRDAHETSKKDLTSPKQCSTQNGRKNIESTKGQEPMFQEGETAQNKGKADAEKFPVVLKGKSTSDEHQRLTEEYSYDLKSGDIARKVKSFFETETGKERQIIVRYDELLHQEPHTEVTNVSHRQPDEVAMIKASINDFKRGKVVNSASKQRCLGSVIRLKDIESVVSSSRPNTMQRSQLSVETEKQSLDDQNAHKSHFPYLKEFSHCKVPTNITVCVVDKTYVRHHPAFVNEIPWERFEGATMRTASFRFYPQSAAKPASVLATAGFVYTGDGTSDKVICFFCYAEKENWEAQDNVEEVHRLLSPSCPQVLINDTNNTAAPTTACCNSADSQRNTASCSSGATAAALKPSPPATAEAEMDEAGSSRGNLPRLTRSQRRRRQRRQRPRPPQQQATNPMAQGDRHELEELTASANRSPEDQQQSNTTVQNPPSHFQNQDFQSTSVGNTSSSANLQHDQDTTDPSHNISTSHHDSQQNSIPPQTHDTAPQAQHRSHSSGVSVQNLDHTQGEGNDLQPHHPNINSQIYSIPRTPRPPSSNEESTTTSNTTESNENADHNREELPRQLNYQDLGIFHERPKFPEFAITVKRKETFEIWPRDNHMKPDDLVKSGLYYAGYGDSCKCFFCGGGLRSWDIDDDPLVEHARWFPKCGYIRQYTGVTFVEAVLDLSRQGGTITRQQVEEHMKQKGLASPNEFDEVPLDEDAAVRSVVAEGYDRDKVCRIAGELRERGTTLSADVILEKLKETAAIEANGVTGATAHNKTDAEDNAEDIEELRDQNYTLRNNLTCKICMDKQVRMVFLPCGHLVACQECAVALQDCPVCRQHIRARVRANIP